MDYAIARENEKWVVNADEIEKAHEFFSGLYVYFGANAIHEIWGRGSSSDNIMRKWKAAEYSGTNDGSINYLSRHDLWRFYSSLDPGNRRLLVAWYNKKMMTVC